MSIIPTPKPRYQYSRVRFFEREHGTEFLKFELEQMNKFSDARKQDHVEIDGYVSWCKPPFFILLPTTTTPNGYIICKVEDGLNYPDLYQFSTIQGKWIIEDIKRKWTKVLLVSDIHNTKPHFGDIKPDILPKDFVGILFDKWRNLRPTTKKLIAQSLVSSPTILAERVGGFTLTMANYSKRNALSMFLGDLRRFIPTDFVKNKSLSFKIPELGITTNLPKFGWEDHVSNLENISNILNKLDRVPQSEGECSITLLQKTMGPLNFDLRGLVKSDYPIVLEEHVERTRLSHYVDPEVYKFIIATRMSAPTISTNTFEQGIDHSRTKLSEFAQVHEAFSKRIGHEQFLDLGYKGKPTSIYHLALSLGRSQSLDKITIDQIKRSADLYLQNLVVIMDVQETWRYDKIPAAATVSFDERRIYLLLDEIGELDIPQIAEKTNQSITYTAKLVKSLLQKNLLFEPKPGKFSSV